MAKALSTTTSGREWRDKRRPVRILPSGNRVRLCRPDILKMAAKRELPDMLTNIIMAGLMNPGQGVSLKLTQENFGQLSESVDVICKACVTEPRIVDDPQTDDEIGLDDIEMADKFEIFAWAFGAEGDAAASFRQQSLPGVGTVSASQPVSPPAESTIGDQEPVGGVAVEPGNPVIRELGGERA